MLSGKQLWSLRIIENGSAEKVDDGITPSYGLDDMLYTFQIEPKRMGPQRYFYLPSLWFEVFKTRETVAMPKDCGGLLTIKSTYGRKGCILTTNSPVDPGYNGQLSMGIFNGSADTVIIDLHGGLMQMTVHQMSEETNGYNGRWQNNGSV